MMYNEYGNILAVRIEEFDKMISKVLETMTKEQLENVSRFLNLQYALLVEQEAVQNEKITKTK